MAETATQVTTKERRLISLTSNSNRNMVVDLNEVVLIKEPVTGSQHPLIVLRNGKEILVKEHYQHLLKKWEGLDTIDYSIEGEDKI